MPWTPRAEESWAVGWRAFCFFFSSRRRHTRFDCDWSSDVCSSDLGGRMSALSEKTRLGLEILGAAAALAIAGDTLLRATPWGLNAFICTAGLVAATADRKSVV